MDSDQRLVYKATALVSSCNPIIPKIIDCDILIELRYLISRGVFL